MGIERDTFLGFIDDLAADLDDVLSDRVTCKPGSTNPTIVIVEAAGHARRRHQI